MKAHLECIPCLLRQALEATKMSTGDNVVREETLREVIDYLRHEKWDKTVSELATKVHRIVKKSTGDKDPYKQLKEKYNKAASELYPELELMVKNSEDRLLTAAKIAVAGNAIDFAQGTEINLKQAVQKVLESEFTINELDRLERLALKSKSILYLADNAGETFFDRILIEELVKRGVNITYVVKGASILNDATLQDAKMAGIDSLAKVTSTGTDCIGVLLNECSKEFLRKFENSKLVISKGQANYESLSDIKNKEIFSLLKVKCPTIAEDIGTRTGSIVLRSLFENE